MIGARFIIRRLKSFEFGFFAMFVCHAESERVILRYADYAEVEIYLFGALLNRYAVREEDGGWFDCVKGYVSPDAARNGITDGFYGAKLSPFPCRLKNGRYGFCGRDYYVGKHLSGNHALHGLLYDADFGLRDCGCDDGRAWARLVFDYDGNIPGYPFAYRLCVRYVLDADGLEVTTTVENTGGSAMPVADGWHPYFTLGGCVDDWTLRVGSRRRLVFDDSLLPTGGYEDDARFLQPCCLKGIGLDNSFLLDGGAGEVCVLQNGRRRLAVYALCNYPVLQLYIPPGRDAVAVENLSGAPDCFNNGIGLLVLAPQERRDFSARYCLDGGGGRNNFQANRNQLLL